MNHYFMVRMEDCPVEREKARELLTKMVSIACADAQDTVNCEHPEENEDAQAVVETTFSIVELEELC